MVQGLGLNLPPLAEFEGRKRRRERILIVVLGVSLVGLTYGEYKLTRLSRSLPFVNSIFFFGLLNINLLIVVALAWLIVRNIGKLFIERRRKILGARLKTKLVIAFLGFSIIPTLVLFLISALYINSSFDKWFSLKIQNTLQASLEITSSYYRNTQTLGIHFAQQIARELGEKERSGESESALVAPVWIERILSEERARFALDAIEYYGDLLGKRLLVQRNIPIMGSLQDRYPPLPLNLLERALGGETFYQIQNVGAGDLVRCLVPVRARTRVVGVLVVSTSIPLRLRHRVDEITSVFDDYRDTNPLKYPMKTTYLVILIMITLVVLVVAIWIGLYMAKELTDPVERLVLGVQAVGAGNLDVSIATVGHDELAVLVETFNRMTADLRHHQVELNQAGADLERRRLQLEALLSNIGTGVIALDSKGLLTIFNPALARLLGRRAEEVLGEHYRDLLIDDFAPLARIIERAFQFRHVDFALSETGQWSLPGAEESKTLAAVATPLRQGESNWGVVAVIDDITHVVKSQREVAWREVARRIAHEIKNPLTPIKLSAQRIARKLAERHDPQSQFFRECTQTIIRHTDELKEMVNEFSNFARLPQIHLAPHALNEVLGELVQLYRQAHPELEIYTEFDPRIPIFEFDRDGIKRVFLNLMSNAVASLAHHPSAPRLSLRTQSHDRLGMVVVECTDNGPGMTEEVRARSFEPYFSTKAEGTGLGLAIAKRIVNDHDGFIRVRSRPGEGCRFTIELPTKLGQA